MEDKAKAQEVGDQIHAIWCVLSPSLMQLKWQCNAFRFCFEPDVSRPLLELEEKFFNEQRAGNGNLIEQVQTLCRNWLDAVPVVAIFTKFDILFTRVYDRKMDKEKNLEIAHATLKEKFEKPLRGYTYPPCAYVRFECMSLHFLGQTLGLIPCSAIHEGGRGDHQEQVGELIKLTAASIDDLALKMLFITVQQNNLEICIKHAVNKYVPLLSAIAST